MADRIGTEIVSDSEKAEVKKMNSAGDEIASYLNMPFSMRRWLLPTEPHKGEEESCQEACCSSDS